ncbi:MAG: hypothetical protein WBX22_01620 [Silvibacterium sp.]
MEIAQQSIREHMPEQERLPLEQHASMANPDPAEWKEDFDRWLKERCIHREGYEDYGGVGALWRDFCEWSIANGEVPAPLQVFEQLLTDAGWAIASYHLVLGLVLRSDLQAWQEMDEFARREPPPPVKPKIRKG